MSTLFFDTQIVVDQLMYVYSLAASREFIDCADTQLTDQFIKQTGIQPGKNACISISTHATGTPLYTDYQIPGSNLIGRKLLFNLYINHHWNPVTIFWKSKSGRDYKLHDTAIDTSDIVFWFESLNTELYVQQLYPGQQLPFAIKGLPFELVVTRLNLDCTLLLTITEDHIGNISSIEKQVHTFIDRYNQQSEKSGKDGFVHNSSSTIKGNIIHYEIDLGSVGVVFFKKLLKELAKMNAFTKVVIE